MSLSSMMGSGAAIPPVAASSALGMGGGRSVSFSGDVNISIMGSTNMGQSEMYAVARRALVEALTEVAS